MSKRFSLPMIRWMIFIIMSKNAYEFLDLLVLTVIAAVAECVDVYAFHRFSNQVYALSIA